MKLLHALTVTVAIFLSGTTARSQSFPLIGFEFDIPAPLYGWFNFRQNDLLKIPDDALSVPKEFQDLSVEHRDYINQLLDVWDSNSTQISLFTCDFCRWDFDRSILDRHDPESNQLLAHQIAKGQVSFSAPDRFRYQQEELWTFRDHRSKSPYACQTDDQPLWICDGEAIFESDSKFNRLYEHRIPDKIREKGECVFPIPFLLGVKRQQILDRYWLRVTTPQDAKNEIWLVAVPKQKSIARHCSKVEIILDLETFFLKQLSFYSPYRDLSLADNRITYEFENPMSNGQLSETKGFTESFNRPKLPRGWEWIGSISRECPRP